MPGGANGIVLAEQIRVRDPSTPVILTTGYNDEMSLDGPGVSPLGGAGEALSPHRD